MSSSITSSLRPRLASRCCTRLSRARSSLATTPCAAITSSQRACPSPSTRRISLPAVLPSSRSVRHASTTSNESSTSPAETQSAPSPAHSPLHDFHLAHGAKMVPFAGYMMPLAYGLPHSSSHHFTRTHASLFDVSHMLQHTFGGRRAGEFLARITPSDVCGMAVGEARLSCLLGADGGIVDDCLVTRTGAESWYVVTNAGCREKDVAYLTRELDVFDGRRGESEVEWTRLEGWGLLALQGPEAETVLGNVLLDADRVNLGALGFGQCTVGAITTGQGKAAGPLLISRGGYTGEDGFEIAIAPQYVTAVAESLLCSAGEDKVQLAGLAARDSLRLEAGMCLYGHDLDETTTPVEASLGWIVAKNRRQQGDFHGAKIILPQLQSKAKGGTGVQRRRVGLIVEGPPAREGADIISSDGTHLGQITSGCPSPTLHKNIAMGYIQDGHHQVDTAVQVVVRGKARSAVVVKMPFVASKYKKSETARPALCMVPELLPSDETTVLDMKRWTRVDSLTVDPHHHVVAVSYK